MILNDEIFQTIGKPLFPVISWSRGEYTDYRMSDFNLQNLIILQNNRF